MWPFLQSFLLYLPIFCFALFFAFYVPGSTALQRLKLSPLQHIVLSLILGMTLYGWQGFIFGFLEIRWLSYIYLIILFVLWIQTKEWEKALHFLRTFSKKHRTIDKQTALLLIVGTLLQMLSIIFNGITDKTGLSFCCSATPDLLYHIALTNQLVKEFPPTEPGMAGIIVHNYHYLSNLVAAELIRVFHLPLLTTLFAYLVILLSLLLGLSAITFGQIITMKKSYIRWLLFFLYFSGDITYILAFMLGKGWNFSLVPLGNAFTLWASPPRFFATVVFFAGISLLVLWAKNKRFWVGSLAAIVFASLISFKIYDGIFMATGIAALFIYYLFSKQFRMLLPLLLTGILSLILYLPVNAQSGGLIFTGMWRFDDFIVSPVLGLQHLELAKTIYADHHNWLGVIRFEILFFVLYNIFVFGTILLGLFQTKKSLSLFPRELTIFLLPSIIVSAILGFFFIQQAGGANSSQFLITIEILGSLYAALACYYWVGKLNNKVKYIVIFLIVLVTIPRILNVAWVKTTQQINDQTFIIDANQLQALTYLKMNAPHSAVILVDNLSDSSEAWKGNFSYYISFLADRSLFIDGDDSTNSVVASHGVDTTQRVTDAHAILRNVNPSKTLTILRKDHIMYLYLSNDAQIAKNPPLFLKPVFNNATICILKVI